LLIGEVSEFVESWFQYKNSSDSFLKFCCFIQNRFDSIWVKRVYRVSLNIFNHKENWDTTNYG
jgi:hypothetical protein